MTRPLLTCVVSIATLAGPTAHAQQVERIDAIVEQVRAKYELPALTAAILTPETITAIGVAGVRAQGAQARATIHDQWHIGSCTKAMTATLIARIVEKTPLSWETTLEEVYGAANVHPDLREITVRQLLGHRSGLMANAIYNPDSSKPIRVIRSGLVKDVLSRPPESPPGTVFEYSNVGYIVAGHIAETATDQSWEELMVTGIFNPLEMRESGFGAPPTDRTLTQPIGHDQLGNHAPGRDNAPVLGPAGTVHCTLSDWARFVGEHMKGRKGESELVSKENYEKLHEALPGPGRPYALGWGTTKDGAILGHSGSNTWWYCDVIVDLNREYAVLTATNIANEKAKKAVLELRKLLIQHHLHREETASP